MERLVLEISADERRQIKTLAAFAGMTMKDFILSKIFNESKQPQEKDRQSILPPVRKKPKEMDETEYLLSNPVNAKRIEDAMKSSRDSRIVFNNLDEVKRALGI